MKVQHLHRSFKIISHGVDLNTNHKYLNHLVVVIRPDGIHIADRPQHSRTVFVMILISISDVFELHASICLGVYTHSNGMSWCHLTGTMKHHKLWIIINWVQNFVPSIKYHHRLNLDEQLPLMEPGTKVITTIRQPISFLHSSYNYFYGKYEDVASQGCKLSISEAVRHLMNRLQFYLAQKSI